MPRCRTSDTGSRRWCLRPRRRLRERWEGSLLVAVPLPRRMMDDRRMTPLYQSGSHLSMSPEWGPERRHRLLPLDVLSRRISTAFATFTDWMQPAGCGIPAVEVRLHAQGARRPCVGAPSQCARCCLVGCEVSAAASCDRVLTGGGRLWEWARNPLSEYPSRPLAGNVPL